METVFPLVKPLILQHHQDTISYWTGSHYRIRMWWLEEADAGFKWIWLQILATLLVALWPWTSHFSESQLLHLLGAGQQLGPELLQLPPSLLFCPLHVLDQVLGEGHLDIRYLHFSSRTGFSVYLSDLSFLIWLCNNSSRTYLAVFPFIKAREILSKESREGGITGVKRTV